MSYVKANFPTYSIPITGNMALRPERAQVATPSDSTIVLGAMCYRESKYIGNKCYIVSRSLIKSRIPWVKKIILFFSELIVHDSRKDITIIDIFRSFSKYIRWCDSEGLHDVLTGEKSKDYYAYQQFCLRLSEKVKTHQLKSASAHVTQSQIKEIYSSIFEDPQFHEGVPNIPKRNDSCSGKLNLAT